MSNMPDPRRAGGFPRFATMIARAGAFLVGRHGAAEIARLERQLRERNALIDAQAAALDHTRQIFNRASEAARIGVWECTLPEDRLIWADVVYDLFDLPRDRMPDRQMTLACYTPASFWELAERRDQAIANRSGFSMDAEIFTPKGNHRWIRITATVECQGDVPVRIFGIKQDITEAKLMLDRTRYLANFDVMTGLANRAQFQTRLAEICAAEQGAGMSAALLLIDLDGFKQVNDTYGHAIGDDCLREAAGRLRSACGNADLIARIGGDEFAVLLRKDAGRTTELAEDIVKIIRLPMAIDGRHLKIGASVGVAFADSLTPTELFQRADTALYAAKAAGRDTFHVFEPADCVTLVAPRSAA
ncbi:diguanylate cyclase domain-containing protein [Rhizobium sp. HT1-10]|uniref:diguanylate cyclase domain-containing protein n=1 Tax=Rhizobium sp. HT1-10 TaxID=3111638 RepID=UPI003C16FD9A